MNALVILLINLESGDCCFFGISLLLIKKDFSFQLLNQLALGGRMLIPVGAAHSDQRFLQVDKDNKGKITVNDLMGVIYVPLTNKENQIGRSQ